MDAYKDIRFPLEPSLRTVLEQKQQEKYEQQGVKPELKQLLQYYAKRGIEAEAQGTGTVRPERAGVADNSALAAKLKKVKRKLAKAKVRLAELEARAEAERQRQQGGIFVTYPALITAGAAVSYLGYELYQSRTDANLHSALSSQSYGRGLAEAQKQLSGLLSGYKSQLPADVLSALEACMESLSSGHTSSNLKAA